LHGEINGLLISSSSAKQIRQAGDSDLHDFLASSIFGNKSDLSFFFLKEGAFVIARCITRALPVPFMRESILMLAEIY